MHDWLAGKKLITQNIDGLDGKAGNADYIPIHGRLDKVTVLHAQGDEVDLIDAPWEKVVATCSNLENDAEVKAALLEAFKISKTTLAPAVEHSLKPFVLLFDEYYTELYRMSLAESWMREAEHFVFMGTSFSVNITNIALRYALASGAKIEVVDPEPVDLGLKGITYHQMTAQTYVSRE